MPSVITTKSVKNQGWCITLPAAWWQMLLFQKYSHSKQNALTALNFAVIHVIHDTYRQMQASSIRYIKIRIAAGCLKSDNTSTINKQASWCQNELSYSDIDHRLPCRTILLVFTISFKMWLIKVRKEWWGTIKSLRRLCSNVRLS